MRRFSPKQHLEQVAVASGVKIATWGGTRTITWAAFLSRRWIDECYVPLSPDWYARAGIAPSGLDAETLKADLQKIAGGIVPPLPGPVPVPVPTPTPVPPTPVPPPQPIPVPVPVPVPPTPVPPVPAGLTLAQAVAAIQAEVEKYNYGLFNVPAKVEAAAIRGLTEAWPKAGR